MTMIASREDETSALIYSPAVEVSRGTPSENANKVSEQSFVRNMTPTSLDAPESRGVIRNSILGIVAVGTILAGTVSTPPAAAETTSVTNARRQSVSPRDGSTPRVKTRVRSDETKVGETRSEAAVAADELKTWLSLSDTELAELCGFARRTLLNWRNGSAAYGASSRQLFAVHALVGHLMTSFGNGKARLWLAADDGLGSSRLSAIAEGEVGLRRVLTQAEPLLFATPTEAPSFDAGLSEFETVVATAPSGEVRSSTAPIRRARKPGTKG